MYGNNRRSEFPQFRFSQWTISKPLEDLIVRMYNMLDTPMDSLPYTYGLSAITAAIRHRYRNLEFPPEAMFKGITDKQVWRWLLALDGDEKLPRVGRERFHQEE